MLGCHFSAYESAEFLDGFLAPWLEYKQKHGLIKISAGHVCFKEFQEMGLPIKSPDNTHKLLEERYKKGDIDYYTFIDKPLTEAEARTEILKPLLEQNIDILWITAPDEIITLSQIEAALEYVKRDPYLIWYRMEMKNLTFSENTYIRGFCPPRIFLNNRGYKLDCFFADDEPIYKKDDRDINYLQLPNKQIPFNICAPLHYSWLDNERSYKKVRYQELRWNPPNGNGCSFKISDNGKLDWNYESFRRARQSIPELHNIV